MSHKPITMFSISDPKNPCRVLVEQHTSHGVRTFRSVSSGTTYTADTCKFWKQLSDDQKRAIVEADYQATLDAILLDDEHRERKIITAREERDQKLQEIADKESRRHVQVTYTQAQRDMIRHNEEVIEDNIAYGLLHREYSEEDVEQYRKDAYKELKRFKEFLRNGGAARYDATTEMYVI